MSAIAPKERKFLFPAAKWLLDIGIIPQCRMGIPLNLVVFFRIVFLRVGFDRLGIGDDDVGSDNAFFQQQFVAFIEQFLNFGVLVTIQEPVKIGGVRQFSEWESDHVTDQRSTSKVSKQFRNACGHFCRSAP